MQNSNKRLNLRRAGTESHSILGVCEHLSTGVTQKLGGVGVFCSGLKTQFLIEDYIVQGNAKKILEITGGLVTHMRPQEVHYEIFDPSEVIASATILSLEEKFLAGEGQNITPPRFSKNSQAQRNILTIVKKKLLQVAQILNLEGYARIDAFVKIYSPTEVEVWIIEINALPAMTPATCIFHQCALSNYTPFEFIHTIIQYGLMKNQQLVPC